MIKISTFYVKNNQVFDNKIKIIGDDVNHIKNVLRYKINDKIEVCDEKQVRYYTKIESFESDSIILNIEQLNTESREMPIEVTLLQGLPKSDKMDFIVQKMTELGIKNIVPIITDRVIVKLDDKTQQRKVERWNKIALEASKQCGRQAVPVVENVTKLENFVENLSKYDIVIVPYECEKISTLKDELIKYDKDIKSIAVVIGPEGGFSEKDIEILEKCNKVKKVSLGKRILRTETAGIATMAMLLYEYEL